ncbi:MAG: TraB/GumN family protein, partial [Bacteroidota bacterium]
MKFKNIFLVWLCCLIQPLSAQDLANSVFWEISGNNLEQPSYLFGTHHLYSPDNVKKDATIKQKLDQADKVVGEIVIDMSALFQVMKAGLLGKDTTMRDLITQKQYEELDTYLQSEMGIGMGFFNKMKPMAIYQMVVAQKYAKVTQGDEKELQALMNESGGSLDGYFQEYAKTQGKAVGGLETVEQQAGFLFDGYPIEKQVELLMNALHEEGESSLDQLEELNRLYGEQNLNEIAKFTTQHMNEDEYDLMLRKRNNAWIPQMETLMKEQAVFFAVG